MRRLRTGAIFALLTIGTLSALHAQREAVPLNDYQRLGQRFTVTRPFSTLWVTVPSWSDAEGGLTLTLWDSPRRVRRLASRAFVNVADNAPVEIRLPKSLPAGTYYWEVDARTGQTRIGLYADTQPGESADCVYRDGAPDRKWRFVFGTVPVPLLRAEVPRLVAALKTGSEQERSDACRQLAVLGGPESVPMLARLLADAKLSHMARLALEPMPYPSVDAAFRSALKRLKGGPLVGVINSVAVRRDSDAVGSLAALLKNADLGVAAAAAVALGRIGTPGAADVLEKAVKTAPARLRPAVYEAGLECATTLTAQGRRERAAALYDRLRAQPAPMAVHEAALRGAMVARGVAGLPLLLQHLRGADPAPAGVALWVAQRELPGIKVTEALVSELGRLPVERRPLLVRALAGRGDRAARTALVRLAGSRDAAMAQAARDGLDRLPVAAATNAAVLLLARPEEQSRQAGIDLILRRRLPGFTPKLLAACRDADPAVRLAALKALGTMADASALPGLLSVLDTNPDAPEAEAAEQALAAACAKAADPEACARMLADRMAAARPAQKASLLRLLGTLGGPAALKSVRAARNDADAGVQATAIDVLCEWKTADAMADLLEVARTASAPADRLRGLRAFLRIAGDRDLPLDIRLAYCAQAARLVERDEEKRLLMGALGGIAAPEALDLALPHLDNPATREEAGAAIVGIAEMLLGSRTEAPALAALEKVAQSGVSPELAQRARALRDQVKTKP